MYQGFFILTITNNVGGQNDPPYLDNHNCSDHGLPFDKRDRHEQICGAKI